MNWMGMLINLFAIICGLAAYIGIMNSKFGKEHANLQYAIMLLTIILACLVGGLLRVVVGYFMGVPIHM